MNRLQDELVQLTADQPVQPADRLSAVTGRARRIRRTRVAVAAAAVVAGVLAVAVPLGLLQGGSSASKQIIPAGPVSSWPDRSPAEGRERADGAVAQWQDEHRLAEGQPQWLYRGQVDVPGGSPLYVVAWVENDEVVMGSVPLSQVGPGGRAPLGQGAWDLKATSVEQAPPVLNLYLQRIDAEVLDDNWLFALADPRARRLHWTSDPLENAPTGGDIVSAGTLTSRNGVFQGWTGTVTGRLTATVDVLPQTTVPLRFPDAELRLARVPDPPTGMATSGISAGAGQLDESDPSSAYSDVSGAGPRSVVVKCYGGGQLSVLVDDTTAGAVACDLKEHEVPIGGWTNERLLQMRGDRFQVFAFAIVTGRS